MFIVAGSPSLLVTATQPARHPAVHPSLTNPGERTATL